MSHVLLAIDVGNTHTVIGVYEGERLVRHWRVLSDPGRTADEYGVLLLEPVPRVRARRSRAAPTSSSARVVPPMTDGRRGPLPRLLPRRAAGRRARA